MAIGVHRAGERRHQPATLLGIAVGSHGPGDARTDLAGDA
jgi:hypothetical protein